MLVIRRAISLVVAAAVLSACDEEPTIPTIDLTLPGVFVRTPSDSVFLGKTLRLSAVATGPDSTDVAWPRFQWASSDTMVAVVDSTGLVQTLAAGVATISAEYEGLQASRTIRVVLQVADGGVAFASSAIGTGPHCALTENGTAYCRVTSPGDSVRRFAVVPGAEDVDLVQLHISRSQRCGLTTSMTIYCWGTNSDGAFLNNNTLPAAGIGARGGLDGTLTFASITVGRTGLGSYTCAAWASDSAVVCAGDNQSQALGRSTTAESPDSLLGPTIGGFRARSLSASSGGRFTCALSIDSFAYCWGANPGGATGTMSGPAARPIDLGIPLAMLSSGWNHVCAIGAQNSLYCWGTNSAGQLGIGTADFTPHPQMLLVAATESFASVTAATSHTCAVTLDGRLLCWGQFPPRSISDRLGSRRLTPYEPAPGYRFRSVTSDDASICGLTIEGRILCF